MIQIEAAVATSPKPGKAGVAKPKGKAATAKPKAKAKESARTVKAQAQNTIREMLLKDVALDRKELVDQVKAKGLKIKTGAARSTARHFLATLKLLQSEGLLKQKFDLD